MQALSLRIASVLVFIAVVVSTGPAAATDGESRQAAQVLFDEGTKLMQSGDYAAACPKLEEAARLYPEGVGVRESLAECYVKTRKYASAEATFDKAIAMSAAKDPERAEKNRARKAEVSPRVSRLRIVASPAVAALPGLTVTRNGQPVPTALLNLEVPVDGGTSTVRVTAEGYAPFEQEIEIPLENGHERITIELRKGASEPGDRGARGADGLTGLTVAGIVTGGIGLVAVGVGVGVAVSGVDAVSSAVDTYTAAHDGGDAEGMDRAAEDHAAGRAQALAGWVTAGIGGAALGAGIIMLATGVGGAEATEALLVTPWWTYQSVGLSAAGRF